MPSTLAMNPHCVQPFFPEMTMRPGRVPHCCSAAGEAEEPDEPEGQSWASFPPWSLLWWKTEEGWKNSKHKTRKWRLRSYEESLCNSAMSEDRTVPFLPYRFQMLYRIRGSHRVSDERAGALRQGRLAHQTLEMIHGILPNPSEGLWFLSRPPPPRALPQWMVDSHSYAADGAQL